MTMDKHLIDAVEKGEKKIVNKWEYLMNYWTPIFALVVLLIGGILWYSNAEARMFSNATVKVQTEEHVITSQDMEKGFITRQEFDKRMDEYLQIAKENREDIKELLKYLRK